MTKNINFNAEDDDTEGHLRIAEEAPSMKVFGEAPGVKVYGQEPGAADDDDTEGHILRYGEAPGISGSLSVDPKTQA